MTIQNRFIYIICLGLFFIPNMLDSQEASDSITVEESDYEEEVLETIFREPFVTDSAQVAVQNFDAAALKAYKLDPDFRYGPDPDNEGIISRLWNSLKRWFRNWIGAENENAIGKLINWLIVGIGLFFVFRALTDATGFNLFRKDEKVSDLPIHFSEDELKQDFNHLIKQALDEKDYRLALRYQFLRILRVLDDDELIRFKDFKTNRDYYYELKDNKLKQQFAQAAHVYEYAWYGEFEVDQEVYENGIKDFEFIHQRARS